ncbi:MAG: GNAT family N-acetyltransferase [Rhodothermales bacterium]
MTIRRARPDEAAPLTTLAHAAKRYWGYPERWIQRWKEELTFTPAFIRRSEVFVAAEGDDIVGVYALDGSGEKQSVEHFWVHPEAMGDGIGRALFEHAVHRAGTLGATYLEIEADPNAVGFYERMGARRVGQRVYRLEGKPRVLPVLTIDIGPTAPVI